MWTGVWKNGNQIRQQEKELTKYVERFEKLSDVRESYSDVKTRHSINASNFDSLRTIIPDRDSFVALLEEIRLIAEQQNIEVKSLSPTLEDSYPSIKDKLSFINKHIERYPVQMSIFGDFLTIGAFFGIIEFFNRFSTA